MFSCAVGLQPTGDTGSSGGLTWHKFRRYPLWQASRAFPGENGAAHCKARPDAQGGGQGHDLPSGFDPPSGAW